VRVAAPSDLILPMLREMRAEFAALHLEMRERFDEVDRKLEALAGRYLGLLALLAERRAAFSSWAERQHARSEGVEGRMDALESRP